MEGSPSRPERESSPGAVLTVGHGLGSILQVVPFLVLAVGADNIFIFVLEYQVRGQEFCMPPATPPLPDTTLLGFLQTLLRH